MRDAAPQPIYLKDYKEPDFWVDHVDLDFDLKDGITQVKARLQVRRNGNHDRPLVLDGENLNLERVAVDGTALGEEGYSVSETDLTIDNVPDSFELSTMVTIEPEKNTILQGLYRSGKTWTTQCESQGFRNITYYPDRPDVLATFTTTVTGDQDSAPVLLSNGDPVEEGKTGDGRHYVVYHDPTPKPAYLFALVGGDLNYIEDSFTTMSGREVTLRIYAEPGKEEQCRHAMDSLILSFKWDEDAYGREYQGNVFNVVAVSDVNSGAMENTTLNIFNDKLVLADPKTATDHDYLRIESVIGHEYFHNWSGNRVTCRDWFQLSLKEGFTVYRDQEFSTDVGGAPAVQRIMDVEALRETQFPEDAGPTAHPIRPESYIEISNFYTRTVYEKGAEVIRMMATLLGPDDFRKATDLYFDRHDGTAATCEDFVKAMEDASGKDLSQFRLWYSQAGTPEVTTSGAYDADTGTYRLTVKQNTAPTPGQPVKQPMHMPITVSLFGADGQPIASQLTGGDLAEEHVLELKEPEQVFEFKNVDSEPVPSLLRNFSAPVTLKTDLTDENLAFLVKHDNDPYGRWDAAQQLSTRVLLRMVEDHKAGKELTLDPVLKDAVLGVLTDQTLDPGLAAELLKLPSENALAQQMRPADPDAIHASREALKKLIADSDVEISARLAEKFQQTQPKGAYAWTQEEIARRALNTRVADYLSVDPINGPAMGETMFNNADNMTDQLAALQILAGQGGAVADKALNSFYQQFQDNPLVLDKWLTTQATVARPETLDNVKKLMDHPAFDIGNPNRVRALVGAFSMNNPSQFHRADGAGYEFLTDVVLRLDQMNPRTAARQLEPLKHWRRYDEQRQALMQAQLQRIISTPGLSRDVFEIASKSLGDAADPGASPKPNGNGHNPQP